MSNTKGPRGPFEQLTVRMKKEMPPLWSEALEEAAKTVEWSESEKRKLEEIRKKREEES